MKEKYLYTVNLYLYTLLLVPLSMQELHSWECNVRNACKYSLNTEYTVCGASIHTGTVWHMFTQKFPRKLFLPPSNQSYHYFNVIWPDGKIPLSITSHYALRVNMYFWVIFYHMALEIQFHEHESYKMKLNCSNIEAISKMTDIDCAPRCNVGT